MPAPIVIRNLTPETKMGNESPKIATREDLRSGARGDSGAQSPGQANKFFELEFSGATPLYQGSSNRHPGGGFIQFLANNANGVGSGIKNTNIHVVTITDDPLFGSVTGLRNIYRGGGTAYSFANQTLFGQHPETQRVYRRLRIRWSSNWQWGNDQLKFCKNIGVGGLSTNCPKFKDNFMHISKLDPGGTNEQQVYATDARADAQGNPNYFIADDINNGFGPNNTDADFTPVNGQWYWLEWEIDAGTPGGSDGWYKIWIDGKLYMSLSNVPVRKAGAGGFVNFELGHVWQNGSPTEDIWMDWHSLSVWDRRPGSLPTGAAFTPMVVEDFSDATVGTANADWINGSFSDVTARSGTVSTQLNTSPTQAIACSGAHDFGKRRALPTPVPVGKTVWQRIYFYLPSAFSMGYTYGSSDCAEANACGQYCDGGKKNLKWMVFGPNEGSARIYINPFTSRRSVAQPDPAGLRVYAEASPALINENLTVAFPRDQWFALQLAVKVSNTGDGWMRVWLDDQLVAEQLNVSTINASASAITEWGIGPYWNGVPWTDGQVGRDTFYIDDIIVASDADGYGAPTDTDANGNLYIAPTTLVGDF